MEMSRMQQSREESARWAFPIFLLAVAIIALAVLTGCSSIDRSVDRCFVFGGTPSYTKSGEAETFDCKAKL